MTLAVASAMAACSPVPNPAYSGPGWYLEKSQPLFIAGPEVFGGPYSYEQCEAERTKLPQRTAELMLCFRHLTAPGVAGPYVTDNDVRYGALPPPGATSVTVTPTQPPPASTGPRS